MLKIGLVGLGNQGSEYLSAQEHCKSLQIVAGFDINEQTRNSAADKRPGLKLASSLDALMKHHLDGLILALPHHVYAEEWEKLLSFGLPILKEKPLGRNLTEARSFVRKAWEKECPLQTAIQRREHPSYKHLLDLLKERKVSDVHFAMHLGFEHPVSDAQTSKQWRDDRIKSGGGALLDCGYHMIDLAHFLVGQFDLLSATLYRDGELCEPGDVDDAMHIVGRKSSTWVYIESRRFMEADGSFGKMEQVKAYTDDGIFTANRQGVWRGLPEDGTLLYTCERDWLEAMTKQLDSFAQHIQNNSRRPSQYWDQLPTQKIIEQAYQMSSNLYGTDHATH